MSVLVVGLAPDLTEALARRLLAQGDEVRIVLPDASERERWRGEDLHVAVGDMSDDDFVWRACMNVRTFVAGDHLPVHGVAREGLIPALMAAGVDRVVVVGAGEIDELVGALRDQEELDHVVLRFRRPGLFRSKDAVTPADLAIAIDAADDLAGAPRLELDLTRDEDWAALRLDPPSG